MKSSIKLARTRRESGFFGWNFEHAISNIIIFCPWWSQPSGFVLRHTYRLCTRKRLFPARKTNGLWIPTNYRAGQSNLQLFHSIGYVSERRIQHVFRFQDSRWIIDKHKLDIIKKPYSCLTLFAQIETNRITIFVRKYELHSGIKHLANMKHTTQYVVAISSTWYMY